MARNRMMLPSLALLGCLAANQDLSARWGCIYNTDNFLCLAGGADGQSWCLDGYGTYGSGNPFDDPSSTQIMPGLCYFA